MFSHFLRLLLLRFRKYEVENHADDGGETDAGNGEGTGGENGATQAHRQHHRDDDDVASFIQINLVLHQILNTYAGYSAEKQQHNAA